VRCDFIPALTGFVPLNENLLEREREREREREIERERVELHILLISGRVADECLA
jgi:hypothetical protein